MQNLVLFATAFASGAAFGAAGAILYTWRSWVEIQYHQRVIDSRAMELLRAGDVV